MDDYNISCENGYYNFIFVSNHPYKINEQIIASMKEKIIRRMYYIEKICHPDDFEKQGHHLFISKNEKKITTKIIDKISQIMCILWCYLEINRLNQRKN